MDTPKQQQIMNHAEIQSGDLASLLAQHGAVLVEFPASMIRITPSETEAGHYHLESILKMQHHCRTFPNLPPSNVTSNASGTIAEMGMRKGLSSAGYQNIPEPKAFRETIKNLTEDQARACLAGVADMFVNKQTYEPRTGMSRAAAAE